jgi:hypothetical protein
MQPSVIISYLYLTVTDVGPTSSLAAWTVHPAAAFPLYGMLSRFMLWYAHCSRFNVMEIGDSPFQQPQQSGSQ